MDEDTILLDIHEGVVRSSDVENYFRTNLCQHVNDALKTYGRQETLIQTKEGCEVGVLVPIKHNDKYTDALIVKRKTRVSITLRHVFE